MLDRLMITCSVIELLVLGCTEGPAHMSAFQWAMFALLLAKLAIFVAVVLTRRRAAASSRTARSQQCTDDTAAHDADREAEFEGTSA